MVCVRCTNPGALSGFTNQRFDHGSWISLQVNMLRKEMRTAIACARQLYPRLEVWWVQIFVESGSARQLSRYSGILVSWLDSRQRKSLQNVHTGSGAHPASFSVNTLTWIQRPGHEVNHSPPSSAEVKNLWSYSPPAPMPSWRALTV